MVDKKEMADGNDTIIIYRRKCPIFHIKWNTLVAAKVIEYLHL
jgi:hypothetical protein